VERKEKTQNDKKKRKKKRWVPNLSSGPFIEYEKVRSIGNERKNIK
jgi:hypothetical protein